MSNIRITKSSLWEKANIIHKNLNHFEDEGILHEDPKYMNNAGNHLKLKLSLINLQMFIKWLSIHGKGQQGGFHLWVFTSQDDDDSDFNDAEHENHYSI